MSITGNNLDGATKRSRFRALPSPFALRWFMAAQTALIATHLAAPAANAQCQYEITGIISPDDEDACWPFPPSNTFPAGMNSHGHVVGHYVPCAIGNQRAFFWSEETGFAPLPHPAGVIQSFANDVNDAGFIVGVHSFTGVGFKGFVFNPQTQQYTYLEPLHKGATATFLTAANAINNQNTVVGDRVITEPGESPVIRNAVIWHPYGENGNGREVVIDLGDFGVGPNSALLDLNADGSHFVGWTGMSTVPSYGVSVVDGQPVVFGSVPTTETSSFWAVSDEGLIGASGLNLSQSYWRAALLSNGTWIVIEPPDGFDSTATTAINNLGQVLILSSDSPNLFRPYLWQNGGMTDLNELLHKPAGSLVLTRPIAVSDEGQVLVTASMEGKVVGAFLIPVDRPETDLNADCITDVYDLLMLLKEWGPCGDGSCSADFTGNGIVGVPDLLILLSNWG